LPVKILPRSGSAGHVCLSAEPAFHAYFARHRGHLIGEGGQRVGHVVDGLGQRRNFALGVHGQLLRERSVGNCGHHLHNAADLLGQVGGHHVDVVGEILPRSGHTRHNRLPAQLAFRAHFAGHARHFGRERVELIHHRVDGVFQFENFALHIHRDLARQIAAGHGRRHFGDVAHLRRQVAGHGVDRVGQILPGSATPGTLACPPSRPSEPTSRATRVTSAANERNCSTMVFSVFFELQNFAAHVHRDLARQIAVGNGRRNLGDVSHLAVRLPAMKLTESVRSFQVPATPGTCACPPSLPSVPTSRATRVTSPANAFS
jgi:hypothetical protein